jgi:hypothetical protein
MSSVNPASQAVVPHLEPNQYILKFPEQMVIVGKVAGRSCTAYPNAQHTPQ